MIALATSIAVSVLLVAFVGGVIWLGFSRASAMADLGPHRRKAEEQFARYFATICPSGKVVAGAASKVLRRSETFKSHNHAIHDYTLTVVAECQDGQHLLFKSNAGGQPYVKLIDRDTARRLAGEQ